MAIEYGFLGILGFSLAAASFGTMLWIFGRQTNQTENLTGMTNTIGEIVTEQHKIISDVGKMLTNQAKLKNEVRDIYASGIVGYVQLMSRSYNFVINLYNDKWEDGEFSIQKREY